MIEIILLSCASFVMVAIGAALFYHQKYGFSFLKPSTGGAPGGAPGGDGTWKPAMATNYQSYPPCCKGEPNYNAAAPTDECKKYSGCEYKGMFAGVSKKLSYDEVAKRNIVSFYDARHQSTGGCAKKGGECAWWNENIANKKLYLKNPSTGKTLLVEALDTCGDADCNKCCYKNANKAGGILIDIEENTAKRFWGASVPDMKAIQWKWA